MGSEAITFWGTPQEILASNLNIVAGKEMTVLTSPVLENISGTQYNSIKINIDYSELVPNFGQFFVGALLEAKNLAGDYDPICYQFSALRSSTQAQKRIMILQPDMDTFNLGIDDIVFPADEETARISRGQGVLPVSDYRLRIVLTDKDPLGASPFVSVKLIATGEKYNV